MCGIVGIYNQTSDNPIDDRVLRQMLAIIRHRGPDEFGIYLDERVGLGNARLSIIDLSTGQQPITNEDRTLWIVFNGEIFNYVELRPELEKRGHHFTTNTDTEVILHLYEDLGPECLSKLNGQFAIAIWDVHKQTLFLARDRLGIRPLFYTQVRGVLIFASEIKSLLVDQRVRAEIDPIAMDQVFTYWSTLTPRTIFKGIFEIPPGHYLLAKRDKIQIERYWEINFPEASINRPLSAQKNLDHLTSEASLENRTTAQYLEELRTLLIDATQIRLRADVPVGAYLSGGLDSSTIAAIVRNFTNNPLDTFSISFSDPTFDESRYQRRMADHLGTQHQVVYADHADIGEIFPAVIWHTETPILRTAPAPMFLLSKLVRDNHYKVVLTGEGADEFLAGYDIFKEAKIRRFWASEPGSRIRPLLLRKLYPDIANLSNSASYLASFFGEGLLETDSPTYSHIIRWKNTSRTKRFFSDELHWYIDSQSKNGYTSFLYPSGFFRWDSLSQAQYLESTIFLSQYLLSSQGDRMAMAYSVEGRYPFLDYRVVEFCNRLPPQLKLLGLIEKYLLRKLAHEWLPDEILRRPKHPYRAPIHGSFFSGTRPAYVHDLLSLDCLKTTGLFNLEAVNQLVQKLESGNHLGETDDMALAGIISSQLIYQLFISEFRMPPPLPSEEVKVFRGFATSVQESKYDLL